MISKDDEPPATSTRESLPGDSNEPQERAAPPALEPSESDYALTLGDLTVADLAGWMEGYRRNRQYRATLSDAGNRKTMFVDGWFGEHLAAAIPESGEFQALSVLVLPPFVYLALVSITDEAVPKKTVIREATADLTAIQAAGSAERSLLSELCAAGRGACGRVNLSGFRNDPAEPLVTFLIALDATDPAPERIVAVHSAPFSKPLDGQRRMVTPFFLAVASRYQPSSDEHP